MPGDTSARSGARTRAVARARSRARTLARALETLDAVESIYVDMALSLTTVTIVAGIAAVARVVDA